MPKSQEETTWSLRLSQARAFLEVFREGFPEAWLAACSAEAFRFLPLQFESILRRRGRRRRFALVG